MEASLLEREPQRDRPKIYRCDYGIHEWRKLRRGFVVRNPFPSGLMTEVPDFDRWSSVLEKHTGPNSQFHPPAFMQPFLCYYVENRLDLPKYFDKLIEWPLLGVFDYERSMEIVKNSKEACLEMMKDQGTPKKLKDLAAEKAEICNVVLDVYLEIEKISKEYGVYDSLCGGDKNL